MIDSHCHLNDSLYENHEKDYIEESKKEGVDFLNIIGTNLSDSKKALEIANLSDVCYASVGIHPSDAKKCTENDFVEIKKLCNNKKVIAIGEIGLDYYWEKDNETKEKQKEVFIKLINLANEQDLPVSIHCRDALEDCLKILKEHKVKRAGVIHCYSGSYEMALEFIKLGYLLGFGGTVTFKNSVKPKEIVSKIPDTSFVLETDAPYLTPVPYRGQPNHSKYLKYVRDEIARLRNVSSLEIEEITNANFKRVFLK